MTIEVVLAALIAAELAALLLALRLARSPNTRPAGALLALAMEGEPQREPAAAAQVDPEPTGRLSRLAPRSRVELDCHVLLVEDGRANERFFSTVLRKAGARVTAVENGQVALDLLLTTTPDAGPCCVELDDPFDVILMDMQMPVMDGHQATERLRQAGYARPIIALTAQTESYDRQKCLAAGCDDYIAKGIGREELLQTVARHVGNSAITPQIVPA